MPSLTPPTCARCIYDVNVAGIDFDEAGICNYCRMVDELTVTYGTGKKQGEDRLDEILNRIRTAGRRRPFDCIIGISGGTDSSYLDTSTVFRATGADLTVRPLFSLRDRLALKGKTDASWSFAKRLRKQFWHRVYRHLDRTAVLQATLISHGAEQPFTDACRKLGIPAHQVCAPGLRLAIDTRTFDRRTDALRICEAKWGIRRDSLLVLLPSRMVIDNRPALSRSGQSEGSDKAIRGFKKFVDELPRNLRERVLLAIPERIATPGLLDAKKLITELDLGGNVAFLRGEREDGLTRDELISLYSRSAAVLDDFGVGWYGSIVVEAMACGAPVITHIAPDVLSQFGWCPMLTAGDENAIAERLHQVLDDDARAVLRVESRRWATEHHSLEAYAARTAPLLERWSRLYPTAKPTVES